MYTQNGFFLLCFLNEICMKKEKKSDNVDDDNKFWRKKLI